MNWCTKLRSLPRIETGLSACPVLVSGVLHLERRVQPCLLMVLIESHSGIPNAKSVNPVLIGVIELPCNTRKQVTNGGLRVLVNAAWRSGAPVQPEYKR